MVLGQSFRFVEPLKEVLMRVVGHLGGVFLSLRAVQGEPLGTGTQPEARNPKTQILFPDSKQRQTPANCQRLGVKHPKAGLLLADLGLLLGHPTQTCLRLQAGFGCRCRRLRPYNYKHDVAQHRTGKLHCARHGDAI